MFWHEYAKIPRHTSQNAITEGDFKCILACNCEFTEQLQVNNQIRTCRQQTQAGKTSGDGCFSACLFYHIEVQEEKVCMM